MVLRVLKLWGNILLFLSLFILLHDLLNSLPMFTVLRRFSIWLTMIGEQIILRCKSVHYTKDFYLFFPHSRQTQSLIAQSSVYFMLLGAVIAASDDLTFNWFGYIFLLINNFCTAAQGIVIKQKLVNKVKRGTKFTSPRWIKQQENIRIVLSYSFLGIQSEWFTIL